MNLDHEFWVVFSKSWGLFYLMALFVGVLVYALRPSRRERFERVGRSILDDDRPLPPDEATPGGAATNGATSDEATSRGAAPDGAASDEAVPDGTAPHGRTPGGEAHAAPTREDRSCP